MKLKSVESVFTIMILLSVSIIGKSEVYIVTIEGEPVISYKGGVNGFEATEKLDVTRSVFLHDLHIFSNKIFISYLLYTL